jgi:hypothetical protein
VGEATAAVALERAVALAMKDVIVLWYPNADKGKRSLDWYVTQLDDAGIRGVHGKVLVAGREEGWDHV